MKNSMVLAKRLLELINELSKVVWYKLNIQKSVAFLCTNNELSEKEISKIIPITIAPKWIKYLGINSTKEMKDLYTKNYMTLIKEIKEDTNKWKDILCSWIKRLNVIKMSVPPQMIYRFNAIPTKIPKAFLTEREKTILHMEPQKPPNSQNNPKQEEQSRRHHTSRFWNILQN